MEKIKKEYGITLEDLVKLYNEHPELKYAQIRIKEQMGEIFTPNLVLVNDKNNITITVDYHNLY